MKRTGPLFPRPLVRRLPMAMLVCLIVHTPQSVLAQTSSATGTTNNAFGLVAKPSGAGETVKFFDENGDGKIDQTEFLIRIVSFSIKRDKNRDNVLTPDELPRLDKSMFEEIDKNGDGKLTDYEFVTAKTLRFESIDVNDDQFITEEEITSHFERRR